MITVLVGQEDGVDFAVGDPGGVEAGEGFARAQPGVDHHRGPRRAQNGRVPAAAAAQDEEFHGCGW
jgi:hypothetical protein